MARPFLGQRAERIREEIAWRPMTRAEKSDPKARHPLPLEGLLASTLQDHLLLPSPYHPTERVRPGFGVVCSRSPEAHGDWTHVSLNIDKVHNVSNVDNIHDMHTVPNVDNILDIQWLPRHLLFWSSCRNLPKNVWQVSAVLATSRAIALNVAAKSKRGRLRSVAGHCQRAWPLSSALAFASVTFARGIVVGLATYIFGSAMETVTS